MPGDTGEDKKTRDTLCFKVAEMGKQWCFFYYSFLQSYQLTQFTSSVFCPWKKFMNLLCDICLGLHCPPHCGNYHTLCPGEGNGNPLQCSCLENPRDGRAWWLPSMGSHRVGHDWSDLAAAAAAAAAAAGVLFTQHVLFPSGHTLGLKKKFTVSKFIK